MGKLIYSMITSLDGYVSDRDGSFGWGALLEETHQFMNDRMRSAGTHLYGRRMYEVVSYWETAHTVPDQPAFIREFARIWQRADKIVYSSALSGVSTERNPDRADIRPGGGAEPEGGVSARPDHRRAGPGGACHPGRAGRRVPAHHRTCDRGWRPPVLAGRCAYRSGTAGRAAVQQRCGLPALRRQRWRIAVCSCRGREWAWA